MLKLSMKVDDLYQKMRLIQVYLLFVIVNYQFGVEKQYTKIGSSDIFTFLSYRNLDINFVFLLRKQYAEIFRDKFCSFS